MVEEDALLAEPFDVVVSGTSLGNSVLSAALALAGRRVLHVDANDFYGGNEATLSVDQIETWTQQAAKKSDGRRVTSTQEHEDLIHIPSNEESEFHDCRMKVHDEELWARIKEDRAARHQFNFDLDSRLVLCRGVVVDALVSSGVAEYLEFKAMDDALMLDVDDTMLRVPCSKTAVFTSKDISMSEKRQLMKFLQFCMDYGSISKAGGKEEALSFRNESSLNKGRSLARPQNKSFDTSLTGNEDINNMNFVEFLVSKCRLSKRLRNCVLHAVALLPDSVDGTHGPSVRDGMERVQDYLAGLARFGKTAFLCPCYGASELSQAFCRLSSVHGGIFMLKRGVRGVSLAEDGSICKILLDTGERITSNRLVTSTAPCADSSNPNGDQPSQLLLRKVVVATGPIVSFSVETACTVDIEKSLALLKASYVGGHSLTQRVFPDMSRCILQIPPGHQGICNPHVVHVVQLDSGIECAAPGFYTIHFSTIAPGQASGEVVLDRAVDNLMNRANETLEKLRESPKFEPPGGVDRATIGRVLELSFLRGVAAQREITWYFENSLAVSPDPEFSIDTASQMRHARSLFEKLCPGEPFLPPMEERRVKSPYATTSSDNLAGFVAHVRVPQPVDLKWFEELGGRCTKERVVQLK